TQISVKDKTEALFYVQAPFKCDLEGDFTYQYTWVPMLQSTGKKTIGGKGGAIRPFGVGLAPSQTEWLTAIQEQIPALMQRANLLDYHFVRGKRPMPNKQGRTPTTMEWARKLTANDIKILTGAFPYSETVPNVDEGFTRADVNDP